MRENRKDLIAVSEIARSADGRRLFYGDSDVVDAVRALEHLLSGFQTAGQLRPDFDPHVMAIAVRAAIDGRAETLGPEWFQKSGEFLAEALSSFEMALGGYKEANEKLSVVKMAKSFSETNEKSLDIKQKINEFVQEIDKCIVLLKK